MGPEPEFERCRLSVGDDEIAATHFRPPSPSHKGVLFIHGWRSTQASPRPLAMQLASAAFTCLTFDLRGHGESTGDISRLSRRDFLADCLAAFDAVAHAGFLSVSVVGSSFGGYMASLLAAEREVRSLVLRAPANYPAGNFDEPQAVFSDQLDRDGIALSQDFPDSRSLTALNQYPGHVLLVESGRDEIIHPNTTARYLAAPKHQAQVTHRVFTEAGHNFDPETKAEYGKLLVSWLGQHS